MRHLHYPLYCRGGSGLSNLVMSCECGVVAAFLLDRVLVIEGNVTPPANVVSYRDRGVSNRHRARITDLMELPVPWLEPGDVDYDPAAVPAMASVGGTGSAGEPSLWESVFAWPPGRDLSREDLRHFARGRERLLVETTESRAAPVLRLLPPTEQGFENLSFYSYLFYLDAESRRAVHGLLRRMRPKAPYAELAEKVSAELGDFNAVHVRRGDFKQTFGTTTLDRTPAEAIARLEQSFGRDELLVILTDEREDPFFDEIVRHYRSSLFLDHHILESFRRDFFELPFHDSIALAYLSQLVAADARDFVGTMTSTYTSLVQRYRGNRGRRETFKFLWNELPDPASPATERGSHAPSDCVPLLPDGRVAEEFEGPYSWNRVSARINPAWQREWPESFLSVPEPGDTLGSAPPTPAHVPGRGRPSGAEERRVSGSEGEGGGVEVTLYLAGGQIRTTRLEADSPILRDLFEVLAGGAEASPARLLQVPLDGGRAACSFSSDRLVALETRPPVLVQQPGAEPAAEPVDEREEAPAPEPREPARRSPPIVRVPASPGPLRDFARLPFVQVTEFLTPEELAQLLATTLAAESSFAPVPGSAARQASRRLEPLLAERIADRLRLLLPQVLPAFEPGRGVEAADLVLYAQRDGDALEVPGFTAGSLDDIACTYFFHREPKPLSGGEIRLRRDDAVHLVEPRNNAVLIHPASALGEGAPLRCPTKAFADSRFAIAARLP